MKTNEKNTSRFRKVFSVAILFLGLNGVLSAQCNASFAYTTSSSGINLASTSSGTVSVTKCTWQLLGNNNYLYGDSVTFSPLYNGTYTVTLSISDSVGPCSSTTTQTIAISGGANAPACSASFTYSIGSSGFTTFTNTSPIDPLGLTNYNWNYNVGNNYPSSNDSLTYYYNGNYVITLNASNYIDNCYTSSTQTITISNAHPAVACTAAFTYTAGAAGAVSFTSLYTGTAPGIQFNCTLGDGSYIPGLSPSYTYTYAYNGTYSVTLQINDSLANCHTSATQTISITNAATMPCTPTVTFVMHQDSINPQPGVWEISSYYSAQVSSAVWFWGDGSSTVGFAPTHTYASAGQYSICVTVYSSCGDSSINCQYDSLYRMAQNNNQNSVISVTVLNVNGTTGINANTKETEQISIYPNPSGGLFMLQINNVSSSVSKGQISITDIVGQVVYNSQELVSNNTISKEIGLQNIANGAYFMKVNVDGKTFTNKIIISK